MKNLKKTFALVLTIAMLATLFMVPVFADGHEDADKLETLGILVGSGDGVTDEYLAGDATRLTAAILLLKLKGLEDEAKNWDGDDTENFNDADMAQSLYAKAIMGYLNNNPEVGFVGDGTGNFNPYDVISAQQYYKVLLTALGYEQGVDFEWSEVLDFAASIGLDAIADVDALTIEDFAVATVEALDTEVNGTGMTLIEKLVDDGVVSEEDATAAGWVFAAVIESAAQIGKNMIEVVFSTDVDTAAVVVKLKQGLVFYYATVAWNAAKDTATLTTAVNPIPAGTYTVEVTGLEETLTMDVTAGAPVASSIDITSSILYTGSSSIAFSVMNQFGEDMAVAGTSVFGTAYISSPALNVGAVTLTGGAASAFTYAAGDTETGDVMQITLVYMGMTVTKAFTVQADPAASTIAFGTVAPLTGDAYIFVSKTDYVVPYEMFDQYGNSIKLPVGAGATIGDITFNSSLVGAIDPASFAVDANGVLTFDTGATAGTAVITAVWNASVVGQIAITVTAAASPASAVVSAPTVLIAVGEAVSLDVVVTDQFGTAHANDTAAVQGLIIDATNCDAVISATTKKLEITNTVAGTATVDILNGATKIGTISFIVQPAAVATAITGTTFTTLFQAGAELTVARDTIIVLDQYGRAFAGGAVVVTDGAAATFTVTSPTIEAVSVGTDVVSVQVGTSNVFPVTVTCIADADITMYTLTSNKASIYTSADSDYFATMTLSGKTAGGAAVVLNTTLPTSITSGNAAIATINAGQVQGVAIGTTTIFAWNGAILLASTTVTVSNVAPVAQTITFSATSLAAPADLSTILVITDQYGVNIAAVGNYAVASSNTAVISAAGATSAGTASVTVVKDGVLSATTLITVN